jgi:acyl-CoA thioesterase-1
MCRALFLLLIWSSALYAQAPLKIVCLGDSVTRGVRPGVTAEQTFCVQLEKGLKEAGVAAQVINSGVGGHKTSDGLARFERDVLAHKPSHVVIMFGLNDSWIDTGQTASRLTVAEYAANLKKMLALLRERKIAVVLMTANPVAAPKYPPERNVTLKPYVEAVRTLAREEQLPLVDLYARFAELALEGTDLNTLFTDAMHPNPKGHALIAALLQRELLAQQKRKP